MKTIEIEGRVYKKNATYIGRDNTHWKVKSFLLGGVVPQYCYYLINTETKETKNINTIKYLKEMVDNEIKIL